MLNDKPLQPLITLQPKLTPNPIPTDIDITPSIDFSSEINNYNSLLQRIISISNNPSLNDNFKSYISSQMIKADNLIKANLPNYTYGVHILKLKCELYNFLQKNVIDIIKSNNNNDILSNKDLKYKCFEILEHINKLINDKEQEMVDIVDKIYLSFQNDKINNIKTNNEITQENEQLRHELKEHQKQSVLLEHNYRLLRSKCGKMQQENEVMTNQLLSTAYKLASNNNNNNDICSCSNISNNNNSTSPKSKPKQKSLNITNNNNYRHLTQDTLLELIDEIYKSKQISNAKNTSIGKPLDTMEQHMYSFLHQKYGLKNIVTEVANTIITSIKDYAKTNNEIRLFGLILQNEIEEKSIQILNQIKQILNEALTTFIQDDNPYKDKSQINDIVSQCKKGFVTEDVWLRIIAFIFQKDKNAEQTVIKQTYEYINTILNKSLYIMNCNYNTLTRSEKELMNGMKTYQKKITYKDLFNIILGYHIKSRDVFLKPFKTCFKKINTEHNGILTKMQFYALIISLNIFDNDTQLDNNIDTLIMKLPHCEAYDTFTFSEVVDLLENTTSPKVNTFNILEYIASTNSSSNKNNNNYYYV